MTNNSDHHKPYSVGHNYSMYWFFLLSHTIAIHLPHTMSLATNNKPTKKNSSSNVSNSTDHALNVEAKIISLNNSNTNNPCTPKWGFQHVYKST